MTCDKAKTLNGRNVVLLTLNQKSIYLSLLIQLWLIFPIHYHPESLINLENRLITETTYISKGKGSHYLE